MTRISRPSSQSAGNEPAPAGMVMVSSLNCISDAVAAPVNGELTVNSRPGVPLELAPTSGAECQNWLADSPPTYSPGPYTTARASSPREISGVSPTLIRLA
ncbi:hypothetical protein D3C80_1378880 [compost metagenome]